MRTDAFVVGAVNEPFTYAAAKSKASDHRAFNRMLSVLVVPLVVLMTESVARAQSSLWDSLIWDQDVWHVPEPDPSSMALAGTLMLLFLRRARRSAAHVNPRRPRRMVQDSQRGRRRRSAVFSLIERGGRMEALRKLCAHSTLLVLLACPPAWGQLTIPNTFTPGTPAVADEVNQNFEAVALAIDSGAGVEFINNVGSVLITNIDTLVASIDVAAPATGYLIVDAAGNASCSSATSLTIRLHNATTIVSSPPTGENRPAAIQGLTMYYSTHYVFAVGAGSNIIQLTGSCTIGTGVMNANSLSAIFVPNRYSP